MAEFAIKPGSLKATVKNLILFSDQGLSGNEIGEIVQLSPRSFMHHFRELEGVLREKHGGVYVYFSDDPAKCAKQSANRVLTGDVEKIGDATAVKILVEYIKRPEISTEQLSDLLRRRQGCRISASELESFLSFHGLFKKKARCDAIIVLSQMRRKRREDMNPERLFPTIPEFPFRPEKKSCPGCENAMNVLKTTMRTVITMGIGKFIARETHLSCPRCGKARRCEDLHRLVPFKGRFGYDVLVHVGKSLCLRGLSEQAVAAELKSTSIDISESEIRYLGQKFVAYLGICHDQSQLKIRLAMAHKGGYILHIDGTCEGGSPHLFTGMDEISGIVLSSVRINSEKKELIVPFLRDLQAKYGVPLAVVSDMGKGLLAALEIVFPGIPILICHFHFLRDIGKDLLDEDYRTLRNQLKKSKIRTALKNKAKDFESKLGKNFKELASIDADSENAAVKTALLIIHWIFDTSELSGYGFPFDMQHFLFYKRIVSGYEKVGELLGKKEWDGSKTC